MTTYVALGGDWGTPTTWSTGTVPNSADADVQLLSPSAAVTLATGGVYSVRSLSIADDSLELDGTLGVAQAVTLGTGAAVTMGGGQLTASQIVVGQNDTLRGTGTIDASVVDNGILFAGSRALSLPPTFATVEVPETLVIDGDVSGTGLLELGSDSVSVGLYGYSYGFGTITLNGASANSVLFEGGFGKLRLGDPSAFTGVISTKDVAAVVGALSRVNASFEIDLVGVSYASVTGYTYSGDASGGTLSIQTSAGTYAYRFGPGFELSDFALSGTSDLAITVTPKPLILGTVAGQQIDSAQSVQPFPSIVFSDSLAKDVTNTSVTVSVSGGAGTWSNTGSAFVSAGSVTLNGDPASLASALQALVFTPTPGSITAGAEETLTFTVTYRNVREPDAVDSTTTVLVNGVTTNISQPGLTINASHAPVSFTATGGGATIVGDYNTISAPSGLIFTINGVHDAAYLSGGQVYLGPASDVSIVGDHELAYVSGDGGIVGFTGVGDVAYLSNGIVYVGAQSDVVIVGDGVVANTAASGDVLGFYGKGDTAEISNGVVYLAAGADVVIRGDGDIVNTAAAGVVMGFVGKHDVAEISNGTIYVEAGSDVVVVGDGDIANTAAAGVVLGFIGRGDTAEISNGTIYLGGATEVTVLGDNNVANTAAAGDVLSFRGKNNIAEITDGTVHVGAGSSVTIVGDANDVTSDHAQGATMNFTGQTNIAEISFGTVGLANASVALIGGYDVVSLSHLFGTNTLTGFDATDTLQFAAKDFASAADVLSKTSQSGGDTLIRLDDNDVLRLAGFTATNLSASQIKIV